MATGDCSRICWHSSKPSTSGSIRSSSTMSGSSVSSRSSARSPSSDTTVSKPRTARLDRIRSTMFGSSSTTRARVLPGLLGMVSHFCRGRGRSARAGGVAAPGAAAAEGAALSGPAGFSTGSWIRKQVPRAGWSSSSRPPCAATMPRAMDSPRPDPELAVGAAAASARTAPAPRRAAGPDRRRPPCTSTVPGPSGAALIRDPGAGRVVAGRVAEQVDEDLLQPVVVGPDRRQPVGAVHLDQRAARAAGGQAGDGRVEHQRDAAPVALQLQDAGLDGGEAGAGRRPAGRAGTTRPRSGSGSAAGTPRPSSRPAGAGWTRTP